MNEPWRSQTHDARAPRARRRLPSPFAPARHDDRVAALQAAVAAAMQTEPAQFIGRITGVSGYGTQVELASEDAPRAEIGSLVKVRAQNVAVVGIISSMAVQPTGKDGEKDDPGTGLVGEVRAARASIAASRIFP